MMTSLSDIIVILLSMALLTSSLQVIRSGGGDSVYNSTCFTDAAEYNCRCPQESPTFLEHNCSCVSDSTLLAECDQSGFNESVLTPEFILANVSSQGQLLAINQTKANETVLCDSILNITAISEQQLECNFTLKNNTIQIMDSQEPGCPPGLYKLQLNCSLPEDRNVTSKCVIFKLVNSPQNASESPLGTCQPMETPSTPHAGTTSSTSSTVVTTTEELNIWLRYNRVLIYVVVGGGCGIGLVLVFIIMLCLLAGCVVSKNRKNTIRVDTVPGSRGHRHPRASNPHLRQTLTYSITNLPDFNETSADPFEGIMPQELTGPGINQVNIPLPPRRDVDDENDVTFDTFKRREKSEKQSRGTIPDFEKPPEIASTVQATNPQFIVPTSVPTVPAVSTPSPLGKGPHTPNPKPPGIQLPKLEIHTVKQDKALKIAAQPSVPVEEACYETVTQTIENETYDNLDHLMPITKQSVGSLSEYSQLHSYPQSPEASPLNHAYSMVTIRTGRTPSSPPPAPPPLSPSYNGLELLGPRSRFTKDILQSSWSKPSMMDQVTARIHGSQQLKATGDKGSQQLLEIYDYPTAMTSPSRPPIPRERKKGVVKISTGNTEVIYDVPPSRQQLPSDGESHVEHISATRL